MPAFLVLLCLSTGHLFAMDIPVIGRTTDSRYIYGAISEENYIETLTQLKAGIDSQLISTLPVNSDKSQGLKLKKISVGLGASGEIGIGPYKFGKAVKQRFVYGR
jgi:hypothetical protein